MESPLSSCAQQVLAERRAERIVGSRIVVRSNRDAHVFFTEFPQSNMLQTKGRCHKKDIDTDAVKIQLQVPYVALL